jgi:hypothetical protein
MELKYLHINEKQYTEELLISPKQAALLKKLLSELILNEVLIINTNLGLEIYYESSNDCTNMIKTTLSFIVSEEYDVNDCLDFHSFQNASEIQRFIDHTIEQVKVTPRFFNYTRSIFSQLELQYTSNKKLIGKLSNIWNEVEQNLRVKNVDFQKIQILQGSFQDIYINNIEDEVQKELVVSAINKLYAN